MLDSLDQLVELQDLDSRLARFREELGKIPVRRQTGAERRARGDEELEVAQKALADCETRQRQAEANLQDREAMLLQLEGKQHQVKSNEAYTALLAEMEQTRGLISEVETVLLEGMEEIESARGELSQVEERISAERDNLDADEKVLAKSEKDLEASIEGLEKDRVGVCGNLGGDVLSVYQRVLKRRQPALVLVTEELCTGCRVGIPAQDFIEILTAERLVTCMNCNRILLHPDKLRAEGA
ncbi:C4-type zinc ribbon domain-containing protein [Myxococcota bacterium]|nr:C4-type zinc ribbon domain-containing protein [Myxococcota bacterium]